jgi:hypothetical protein
MIKLALSASAMVLATLPGAAALGNCSPDKPEIGDIGPSSELVCETLERRFPGVSTAVENRTVLAPDAVKILVSVDGAPGTLDYRLDGFVWHLTTAETAVAAIPTTP